MCTMTFTALAGRHLISSTLPKLVSGYLSPSTIFHSTHPFWIFKAYRACDQLPSPRSVSIGKTKISNYCALIFSWRPTKKVILRCRQSTSLSRPWLKKLTDTLIGNLPISRESKPLLRSQTSIIQKRNRKIKDILCNEIALCKSWTLSCPTCDCLSLAEKYSLSLGDDGHISCFGKDAISSVYRNVLSSNVNDVCEPIQSVATFQLFHAILRYLKNLFDFMECLNLTSELHHSNTTWQRPTWKEIHPSQFEFKDDRAKV